MTLGLKLCADLRCLLHFLRVLVGCQPLFSPILRLFFLEICSPAPVSHDWNAEGLEKNPLYSGEFILLQTQVWHFLHPALLHKKSGPHQMPRWPWPGLSHWRDLWAWLGSALSRASQSPRGCTCGHFTAARLRAQMLECVFPTAATVVAAWGSVELTACLAPCQASLLAFLQNSCLRGQTDHLLAALLDVIVF